MSKGGEGGGFYTQAESIGDGCVLFAWLLFLFCGLGLVVSMLRYVLIPLGANITEREAQHALRRSDVELPPHIMLSGYRSSRPPLLFAWYQSITMLHRLMSMQCDYIAYSGCITKVELLLILSHS